jgi:hypothetical protein
MLVTYAPACSGTRRPFDRSDRLRRAGNANGVRAACGARFVQAISSLGFQLTGIRIVTFAFAARIFPDRLSSHARSSSV